MIQGSCCCGAVKFELLAAPTMMGTCHCSRCRKAGASTIVFVKRDDLKWHQGKENVATYKPDAPYKYCRCFCKICGTSLGEILSEDATFPIAANALDTDTGLKNQFHEFTSEKPSWYEICDDAPQSQGHPSSLAVVGFVRRSGPCAAGAKRSSPYRHPALRRLAP